MNIFYLSESHMRWPWESPALNLADEMYAMHMHMKINMHMHCVHEYTYEL